MPRREGRVAVDPGSNAGSDPAGEDVEAATLREQVAGWFRVPPDVFLGFSPAALRDVLDQVSGTRSCWGGVLDTAFPEEEPAV